MDNIEDEQTTQRPKVKVQKDKPRSPKHAYKTKSRMDNSETHVTLGTSQRSKSNKTRHTTQKTRKVSNTYPIKTLVLNVTETRRDNQA